MPYALLADLVLVAHVAVVLFVVGGAVLIFVGNQRRFKLPGVNGWPFRLAHLVAIGTVVAQVWLGVTCPLTVLEMSLRERAGAQPYAGGFIEHWLQRALYYDLPGWMFTLAYSAFGLVVALLWVRFPPQRAGCER